MSDAVASGKLCAFIAADIGDDELQLGVIEIAECVPGLALQGNAQGTPRVVDLDDGRRPIADSGEVLLSHHRPDLANRKPAAAADGKGRQSKVPGFGEECAPRRSAVRDLGRLYVLARLPSRAFGLSFLPFHGRDVLKVQRCAARAGGGSEYRMPAPACLCTDSHDGVRQA
ncbi:MAG: hypothetical protein QNJ94_14675 [Alphaproteobacteria bacterium]|nr:hypothetical protein [Alphaproteobacteria bacterium]